MKKVLTIGRDIEIIHQLLTQEGLELVENDPDVIITHGGDGYLLEAEQRFPGVPKLPIRRNSICKMCIDHDTTHAIKALARGDISKSQVLKIEATWKGQKATALNEFSLHHVHPQQAIRFSVQINDEDHIKKEIGDGLIIATPFGSHAYYRSVTNSTFRTGIGVAFNNTTESIDHMVVREDDVIRVTVDRGPVYFLTDNNDDQPVLDVGDTVEIRAAGQTATLLGLDHFRCPDCGEKEATVAESTESAEESEE